MAVLTREQLEERLVALHQASLELVSDLSLEAVLERIVHLAREQSGARYAALGMVDEQGKLEKFIPVGMEPEEITRLEHGPEGHGLLGALMTERRTIRIPDIELDERKVGFPPNHPPMRSFLGVPILLGDRLLGHRRSRACCRGRRSRGGRRQGGRHRCGNDRRRVPREGVPVLIRLWHRRLLRNRPQWH